MPDAAKQITVGLLGATGLVGREILGRLIDSPNIESIVVYVRKVIPTAAKVRLVTTDFVSEDFHLFAGCDVVFCALGTTIAKAKSKEAFRAIDYDLVLRAAKAARERGVKAFFLVSSQGADARSSIFYLKTKGEIERDIAALGFRWFVTARPSLLLGERSEQRSGESLAKALMKRTPWNFLPGFIKRFEPIEAGDVAKALIALAGREPRESYTVLESQELMQIAREAD